MIFHFSSQFLIKLWLASMTSNYGFYCLKSLLDIIACNHSHFLHFFLHKNSMSYVVWMSRHLLCFFVVCCVFLDSLQPTNNLQAVEIVINYSNVLHLSVVKKGNNSWVVLFVANVFKTSAALRWLHNYGSVTDRIESIESSHIYYF